MAKAGEDGNVAEALSARAGVRRRKALRAKTIAEGESPAPTVAPGLPPKVGTQRQPTSAPQLSARVLGTSLGGSPQSVARRGLNLELFFLLPSAVF